MSTSSTAASQAASDTSSPQPSATWERLDVLLTELESEASRSSESSRRLEASLRDARAELTRLSSSLAESRTQARELSSSLESCERSLALSEASLAEAKRMAGRSELELKLWRGAAFAGLAFGAGALLALAVK